MTVIRWRQRAMCLSALVVVAVVVTGCGATPRAALGITGESSGAAAASTASYPSAAPLRAPDFSGTGPGSLVKIEPMRNISLDIRTIGARATRVYYRSVDGSNGQPTVVSGMVAVPPGTPPKGGWPIVAYGTGTSGVESNCGPSTYNNLLGADEIVMSLLLQGYAVTLADKQGLGVAGSYFPYLDARVAGRNIIDSVRAARKLDSSLSDRWASIGVSAGGQASWAAADLAGTYGGGLTNVGNAALVPASNVADIVDKAWNGTLTRDQYPILVFVLNGLRYQHPEMRLSDYAHGLALQKWNELLTCTGAKQYAAVKLFAQLAPADLKPSTVAAREQLRGWLEEMSVPAHRLIAPLLVMFGTEDTLVDTKWSEESVRKACRIGGAPIEIEKHVGEGHADLDSRNLSPWLQGRFAGAKAIDSCGDYR